MATNSYEQLWSELTKVAARDPEIREAIEAVDRVEQFSERDRADSELFRLPYSSQPLLSSKQRWA